MGALSQSQTVEFIAAEHSWEQKYNCVFKKGLVKQWSDASTNSGRF